MIPKSYPLIRSSLECIFGTQGAGSEEAERAALLQDLTHEPFRIGMQAEVVQALGDTTLSFRDLLKNCDAAFFETETEARAFFVDKVATLVGAASPQG